MSWLDQFFQSSGKGNIGLISGALTNGTNSNIPITGLAVLRLTGPTAAFSVGGFAQNTTPLSGQPLTVINTTTQLMTILHEDASSTPANRIDTQSTSSVTLPPRKGTATFVYDATTSRWVLKDVGLRIPFELNVRDFGAVGNGTTDDTAAITAAVAAAAVNGGVIYFPPTGAYYKVTSAINLASNITLKGVAYQAAGLTTTASVIIFSGGTSGFVYPNGVYSITIEDLTIIGDTTSGDLLSSPTGAITSHLVVNRCTFNVENKNKAAIRFGASGNSNGAQNNESLFTRLAFYSAPQQAVPLISLYGVGGGMGDISFRDCVLVGGGLVGSGNTSTAEMIHVESTDSGITTPIVFERCTLETPMAGGWVIKSGRYIDICSCWAGDITGGVPNNPLIAISTSSCTGALTSQNITVRNLMTDIGANSNGQESINLNNVPNFVAINCNIPSINNNGPGSIPFTCIECAVTNVLGDQPVGISTIGDNGDVSARIMRTQEATAGVVNGLNSNVTPNFYTSFIRLTGSPSAGVSLGGVVGFPLQGGQLQWVYYNLAQTLTIVNEDVSSTASYRITTLTGANIGPLTGPVVMGFIWDSNTSRWLLFSCRSHAGAA